MLSQAEKLLQQGQPEQALPLLVQYAASQPHDAHGWFLLAVASHKNNRLPEALQALEQALSLEPRHVQARSVKAAVLCDLGHPQEALQVYRKALHLAPNDASLLVNMAIVLEQVGELHAALERYDQALEHHPGMASALLNRGALLLKLGRLQEALDNNLSLAAEHPEWEQAQFNLGETLLAQGRWEESLAAYRQALALQPDAAKAHFSSGLALSMLRRFDEAEQAFATARSLDPAAFAQCMRNAAVLSGGELREFTPQVIYLLKEAQRLNACDWSRWDELIAEYEDHIANTQNDTAQCERALLFPTLALPLSAASRFKFARNIAARIVENAGTSALSAVEHPEARAGSKIRIGYVSPDFRKHPIATLSRRLYELHDRERFEVYGYSLRPDDGSPIRRDIENGCDVFRELSALDDRAAAAMIHRDSIDILVDLAGYTSFARSEIFALRPAALQLCYLGFPHSTGADFIDYLIADHVVIPPGAEKYFSERIACLPDSYFLFDDQQAIAPLTFTRESLGLPAEGMVFCCHNSNYKITPDVFGSWMRILQRVPGSVLWLLKSSDAARANLRKEAESRGIAAERLVFAEFMPNAMHLARYRLADLFLDTFLCNAHTTAVEALWAGLPVLTCAGETMAARVAASLLHAIGLREMITHSAQRYEELAVHLASHPDELARIRALLESKRLTAPLFDTKRQVRNIERIYLHIWHRRQTGLPPETLRNNKQGASD